MRALEKYKNSIHRKEIQIYDKLFFAMDAIEELEQQNTALQARIKELEEPKSCTGCEYFEYNYLHKCETCDRQIRNDYFKLKDTK